jgi:nucleoside 2-deoxyribosyltransferase
MGILNKTKVYLGGNLQHTDDAEGWRNRLSIELNKRGIEVLDPTKQMFLGQEAETQEARNQLKIWQKEENFAAIHGFMKEVIRRDLRAVDLSTFLIFRLEPDKPTFGTITEITVAAMQRKPLLFILEDKKKMPLWLIGMVNMDFVFDSEESLLKYLQLADHGFISLDTKYWKIPV